MRITRSATRLSSVSTTPREEFLSIGSSIPETKQPRCLVWPEERETNTASMGCSGEVRLHIPPVGRFQRAGERYL